MLCYSVKYTFLYINIYSIKTIPYFDTLDSSSSVLHIITCPLSLDLFWFFYTCILASAEANLHFSIPCYLVWLFSVILILIPVLNSRVSVFFRLSSNLNPTNCFSVGCFKHQYQKYARFNKNQCTKSLWKYLSWLFNIFLYFKIRKPQKLMQTHLREDCISSVLWIVHWFHWLISPGVILSWINTSDNLALSTFGFKEFKRRPVHLCLLLLQIKKTPLQKQL